MDFLGSKGQKYNKFNGDTGDRTYKGVTGQNCPSKMAWSCGESVWDGVGSVFGSLCDPGGASASAHYETTLWTRAFTSSHWRHPMPAGGIEQEEAVDH